MNLEQIISNTKLISDEKREKVIIEFIVRSFSIDIPMLKINLLVFYDIH